MAKFHYSIFCPEMAHAVTLGTYERPTSSGGDMFKGVRFLTTYCRTMADSAGTLYSKYKFIDIGVNLTDPMFDGVYHGTHKHERDLDAVLQRAKDAGVEKIIITGGSLTDSEDALKLAKTDPMLYCTVGCHPTRCQEFEAGSNPEAYLDKLTQLVLENRDKVVAVGECGLDYDRLEFCPAEIQRKYFELQMSIAEKTGLPLFLHCRKAASDLLQILKRNLDRLATTGVVHSFDGTKSEAEDVIDLGFYVGVNGCSLKTAENLEVVSSLPKDKLMLETDAPWCDIRPSHAGFCHVTTKYAEVKKPTQWQAGKHVKGRNEPDNIVQVLEVVAGASKCDGEKGMCELANTIFKTTEQLFFKDAS